MVSLIYSSSFWWHHCWWQSKWWWYHPWSLLNWHSNHWWSSNHNNTTNCDMLHHNSMLLPQVHVYVTTFPVSMFWQYIYVFMQWCSQGRAWLQILVIENFCNFCNYTVTTTILFTKVFSYSKIFSILWVWHQMHEFAYIISSHSLCSPQPSTLTQCIASYVDIGHDFARALAVVFQSIPLHNCPNMHLW